MQLKKVIVAIDEVYFTQKNHISLINKYSIIYYEAFSKYTD